MNILQLIDIPSFFLVGFTIFAGLIVGGSNLRKGILIARDICISFGIIGMLIGLTNMLSHMEEPSHFGPAFAVALLTILYGLILFVFLQALYPWFPTKNDETDTVSLPEKEMDSVITRSFVAIAVLFFVCIAGILHGGILWSFIDISSIILVVLFVLVPTVIDKNHVVTKIPILISKIQVLYTYSVFGAIIGFFISVSGLMARIDDPATIGPSMAIGLVTSLYCGFLMVSSNILYRAITSEEMPHFLIYNTLYFISNVIFFSLSSGLIIGLIFLE